MTKKIFGPLQALSLYGKVEVNGEPVEPDEGLDADVLAHWYAQGRQRAQSIVAIADPDVTVEELYEIEDNSRQFSPFEFTAHAINELGEFESAEAWEAYDNGIAEVFAQEEDDE